MIQKTLDGNSIKEISSNIETKVSKLQSYAKLLEGSGHKLCIQKVVGGVLI